MTQNLGTEALVGIADAARYASMAVRAGLVREADAPLFMSWILDAYRDETVEYVDAIGVQKLWMRCPAFA